MIDLAQLLPGGIWPTDRWHIEKNDGTCSRCRRDVPEGDVPLLVFAPAGHNALVYCERCLDGKPPLDS